MNDKVVRLQIEINQSQKEELEHLVELTGLRTKKELLNNALTLLKWAVRERARGSSICSVNEKAGVYKELQMPILENVVLLEQTDRQDTAPRALSHTGLGVRAGSAPHG